MLLCEILVIAQQDDLPLPCRQRGESCGKVDMRDMLHLLVAKELLFLIDLRMVHCIGGCQCLCNALCREAGQLLQFCDAR